MLIEKEIFTFLLFFSNCIELLIVYLLIPETVALFLQKLFHVIYISNLHINLFILVSRPIVFLPNWLK